ncbi:hypothetical protein ACYULU_05325 [Breznakiellaceae bacterium SP9]
MKIMRRIISLVLLSVGAALCFAQTTETLETAIDNTSTYIMGQLPLKAKVLLMKITAPDEAAAAADYTTEKLSTELVNCGFFTMVDRSRVIDSEITYQLSGNVSDETAQAIGKQTGAEIVVWGALDPLGTFFRLNVKAINVRTAELEGQRTCYLQMDTLLSGLLNRRPQVAGLTQSQASPALVQPRSAQNSVRPDWLSTPFLYGPKTYETSAAGISQYLYEVGLSHKAASERLARDRAIQGVQAGIAAKIASDFRARTDIDELSVFLVSEGEDMLSIIQSSITNLVKTRVPRFETLEWFVETEKDTAGKAWYIAYALVRFPRSGTIDTVDKMDIEKVAQTAVDAAVKQGVIKADAAQEARETLSTELRKSRYSLSVELKAGGRF